MSLPDAWVRRLMARLQLRYGEEWRRQYAGLEPDAVKADWAHVLSGLSLDALEHGVSNLPTDRPPNAMQFRSLCVRAPQSFPPALPAPKADPGRVKAILQRMRDAPEERRKLSPAGYCVHRIMTCTSTERSGKLTASQAHVMERCLRVLTSEDREVLASLGH